MRKWKNYTKFYKIKDEVFIMFEDDIYFLTVIKDVSLLEIFFFHFNCD